MERRRFRFASLNLWITDRAQIEPKQKQIVRDGGGQTSRRRYGGDASSSTSFPDDAPATINASEHCLFISTEIHRRVGGQEKP